MKKHFHIVLALFVILLFAQCTASKNAKQAQRNIETLRIWFEEGWNHNRNKELIPRVFHPEWSDGNPLRPDQTTGLDGMYELVEFYKHAFPDAHFTITHIFGDERHVALRYEVEATHFGDAFGIPATGKKFTSTGLVIYDMRDGKIYRSWQELDLMGIINQLKN
ncbi:MAG: ester cyclase [Lewinellaceae bacterium]|nr:ester cyclase [Saprospiraceae bacterium]MCB9341595.1 ester cyclase [Lewinellaceae bacterium]